MTYFSEREEGECPREHTKIPKEAWGGIQAAIRARIEDGSFGVCYPETCPDGATPIGTDEDSLWLAMRGEIPNLQAQPWRGSHDRWPGRLDKQPKTLDILDMIEFCWRCVGETIQGRYHDFFDHYHLRFDVEAGQEKFRDDINRIFRRNGLAYEITNQGRIERLVAPVLREELISAHFDTSDHELDRMLEKARRKFLDPDKAIGREALEVLWDAWERLKTLGDGADKKAQVKSEVVPLFWTGR